MTLLRTGTGARLRRGGVAGHNDRSSTSDGTGSVATEVGSEESTFQDRRVDHGHGREADSPSQLHLRGWLEVVRRAAAQIKTDNLAILAAGVAFWFFLALVPTIVAVINVYGLVANPSDVSKLVGRFDGALPRDLVRFIDGQLRSITRTSASGLGIGLALAVLAALWSASKGTRTLIEATNAAYDEEEGRSFIKVRLLAMLFTAGGVVIGVGGMVVIGVGPRLASHLGPVGTVVSIVLGWPLVLVAFVLGLGVLYRWGPSRKEARWEWVTPGAIVATVLWVLGSALFALYANGASSFNETYGSLGAIAIVQLWLLITAFAVLLGAEINGEAERQTRRDTTDHPAAALGERGAFAADTVAGERETPDGTDPD
ncbi:MAG: YihY/virulence factor BrkB family protein [Actinomycetota bacterium]|nr:YihY/virulence factor BrkB family protein [Actinomycetota bacterium]